MSDQFRNLKIETEELFVSENYSKVTFYLQGALEEYDAYLLRNNLENWLNKSYSEYLFDLKSLDAIDIAGVNVLVQIKKSIEEKNATCTFIVPFKKKVLEPIYLTKLEKALNIEYYLDNELED